MGVTDSVLDRERLEAPAARRRMLVVVNPKATSVDGKLRRLVVAALQSRYEVVATDTSERGHATELAREAARDGVDVVVSVGGDGTLNEAANGLVGTGVPLFPLPAGSQNVYAKMLGIPADVVDATEHLLHLADDWRPRQVDLGRVEGRHFAFSAGAGLDASVVERVDAHPERKARWRQWYYAETAAAVFLRRYLVHPPRLVATGPDGDVEGITALVQNGDPYTYAGSRPIRVCTDVALDSGTLSAAVLERATPLDLPTMGARLLSERLEVTGHAHAASLTGLRELRVRAADPQEPFAVQVDGDFLGRFEHVTFDVVPGALTVVA
jgi:diacylglycerol kinase family enzyme